MAQEARAAAVGLVVPGVDHQFVELVCPPLHHFNALVPKFSSRIGAADGVAFDMGELRFDCVRVPLAAFVEDR